MTTFQLDQCLDSKRFARDCAAQGLCQTARLPPSLHDADDPELLQAWMVAARPLVTFDRALPHDHTASIPPQHPGIIVISNYPAPQTMTVRIAQRILGRFKASFPQWHLVAWTDSVVEVTTIGGEVWHVDGQGLVRDICLALDSADWQSRATDPMPWAVKLVAASLAGFLLAVLSGRLRADGNVLAIPDLIACVVSTALLPQLVWEDPRLIAVFVGFAVCLAAPGERGEDDVGILKTTS